MLISPAAVTHSTDTGRLINLKIEQTEAGKFRIRAPRNGNVAPPGYYMLFVVNGKGVPSLGKFVRVDGWSSDVEIAPHPQ